MISPDTLIIVTKSTPHADYTPIFSGVAASVLVGMMAYYGTRTQRKIAEKTLVTQREISDAAINTQRIIAKQSVDSQMETARRTNVVESRREWMRELRKAVSDFEGRALAISRPVPTNPTNAAAVASRAANMDELVRLMTVVVLLMDKNKDGHKTVIKALNGVMGWATRGGTLPEKEENESTLLAHAREFESMNEALNALDDAVGELLEAAWARIRMGE
jgi:hypothetical protein